MTVLIDALAFDDVAGREDSVVVQGDGLTYSALAELLHRSARPRGDGLRAEGLLPRALLDQIAPHLHRLPQQRTDTPGRYQASGAAGDPATFLDARHGTWELELTTRVLTWDLESARLIDADTGANSAPWDDHVRQTVHPRDQHVVHDALARTCATGAPYNVRFRTRTSDDDWSWCWASGRRLDPPSGLGARVVGVLAA